MKKLTDKHPLMQRFNNVLDAFEKEGIKIDITRYGEVIITDTRNKEEFLILDEENNGNINELPPVFEFKIVKEDELR